MSKRRFIEFVIDPSSGELSASRFLLMVLILAYLPVLGAFEVLGVKLGIWNHFAVIVGSVAGVYGANTAGRVWRSGYQELIQSGAMGGEQPYVPPGPPPQRAKPAP